MRVVIDTDVMVAALRSPTGASAELLRRVEAGSVKVLVSVALVLEYEAICVLPEHRIVAGLTLDDVRAVLDRIVDRAEPVRPWFRWRPRLRDADDELVLDAAVNGTADAIVTFNRRDFGTVPAEFGIDVLLPREALTRLSL